MNIHKNVLVNLKLKIYTMIALQKFYHKIAIFKDNKTKINNE
jgi:hypothetical protein